MKIQDIPQVGKLGLTVTWHGRNGQLRRILAIPKNPRTDRQLEVRDLLQQQARRFDALTDVQQDAWNVAATGFHSTPSLGQSGPLTGLTVRPGELQAWPPGPGRGGRAAGGASVPGAGAPGPGHH